MIYLSGVCPSELRALLPARDLGLMWTPRSWSEVQHVAGAAWAADNGCFSQGAAFDPAAWLAWLYQRDPTHALFAVAPDVVGDAAATIARSEPYYEAIWGAGFTPAFVLQDGQEDLPVPWSQVGAVFIGGSTAWKLGAAACRLAYQAKDRGVWVHMGRVNSARRLRRAAVMGCDSADGTFLRWAPRENVPRMRAWLAALDGQPTIPLND